MPSTAHEAPLELTRLDPSMPDWLLTDVFGDAVTGFDHARMHDPNVRTRTFLADAMIVYCDRDDRPVRGVVFEVQLDRSLDKLRTWALYCSQLAVEIDADVSLLVFVPDPAVAAWYRNQLARPSRHQAALPLAGPCAYRGHGGGRRRQVVLAGQGLPPRSTASTLPDGTQPAHEPAGCAAEAAAGSPCDSVAGVVGLRSGVPSDLA